ncbi:MAG: Na+/H+ antiporter NhaA [Usitatibacteraceae bacterium]
MVTDWQPSLEFNTLLRMPELFVGVLLAFAIPFSPRDEDSESPSHRLEAILHAPVAYIILPIFALANTAVIIGADWMSSFASTNSIGIVAGLVVGKPLGITLFCGLAVATGLCKLPADMRWAHIIGAGMLGGIGFTMSIFITNLAFSGNGATIDASKIAILAGSLVAAVLGFVWLRLIPHRTR